MNTPFLGITWFPGLAPLLGRVSDLVEALEVEPEAFWVPDKLGGASFRVKPGTLVGVETLSLPKVLHCLATPVGGVAASHPATLAALRALTDGLDAPWVSGHLSFNPSPYQRCCAGYLLPPLQTPAGVATAVANIRATRLAIGRPYAVEPEVNYLRPQPGEMPDGEFFAEVTQQSDCLLLLDLHNLYANARNGRQPVEALLRQLPLDRVVEIHLSGGLERCGYWTAAQSGVVPSPVLGIFSDLLPDLPSLRLVTFELRPTWLPLLGISGVERELRRIRALIDAVRPSAHGGRLHTPPARGTRVLSPPRVEVCRRSYTPVKATTPGTSVLPGRVPTLPTQAPLDARGLPGGDRLTPAPLPPNQPDIQPISSPAEWEAALLGAIRPGAAPPALSGRFRGDPGIALYREMILDCRLQVLRESVPYTLRLLQVQPSSEPLARMLTRYAESEPPQVFGIDDAELFLIWLGRHAQDVLYLPDIVAYERAIIQSERTGRDTTAVLSHDPVALLRALLDNQPPRNLRAGTWQVEITP